tara:strand:+ start:11506 stop:13620 length:2115 start_codon:yes stop_codon:yes gene_type:complete
MIVELYVKNIRGQYVRLDTYGNENVALTFQIDDIRDISTKNASYSKTFNLPATKNNNDYFNHFYDTDRYDSFGEFTPYISQEAYLMVDGIIVLEGFMRLDNSLDKQTEITYTVVLFNETANLIDTLGDATMCDIDWSYLNHERSFTNVFQSWYGTEDYSYQLVNVGNIVTNNGAVEYDKYQNYVLSLKLKAVIDKIFAFAGFQYTCDLFDTYDFGKLYFDTGIDGVATSSAPTNVNGVGNGGYYIANVGSQIDLGTPVHFPWQFDQQIQFGSYTGNQDGYVNGFGAVTLTTSAQVFFNITLAHHTIQAGNGTVTMLVNGVAVDTQSYYGQSVYNPNNTYATDVMSFSHSGFFEAGDVITLTFANSNGAQSVQNGFATAGYLNDGSSIQVYIAPNTASGIICENLGKVKLKDIIKDVVTMFNLTIVPESSNKLTLTPYSDFVSTQIIDWTNKVDANEQKVEVVEIPKRLEFKHAEDSSDVYHETYSDTTNTGYGNFSIEFNTDSDEVVEIKLNVFASPVIRQVVNTNVVCQHIGTHDDDNLIVPFKNKPRIVYLIGNTTAPNIPPVITQTPISNTPMVAINDAAWNVGVNTQYLYNGMTWYADLPSQINANTNSYVFGNPSPLNVFTMATQPVKNLFMEYWIDYVSDRFNADNILLKIKAKITPLDIHNLDFGKIYQIDNQHYRLNKLNYNTDRNKLSELELIRI